MLTPLAPNAGPTGGEGLAAPPLICNLINSGLDSQKNEFEENTESAELSDPISDDDFQSALEEQIQIPTAPVQEQAPAPRMPEAKEFPAVAQQKTPEQVSEASENGPMGLLKRIATGFGGSSEQETKQETVQPAAAPAPVAPQPAPVAREGGDPYAPPRNGTLDIHGRQAPAPRAGSEEDQLDIPAFLRRQANWQTILNDQSWVRLVILNL